jgi:uncharacterized protein (TIGR03066 family)
MMKKLFALLSGFAFCLAFAGCGSDDEAEVSLTGIWKTEVATDDFAQTQYYDFKNDGTFSLYFVFPDLDGAGKTATAMEGSYTLKDDQLTLFAYNEGEAEEFMSATITKLTSSELFMTGGEGEDTGVLKLQKVSSLPDIEWQWEW